MSWTLFFALLALIQGIGVYLDNYHFRKSYRENLQIRMSQLFYIIDSISIRRAIGFLFSLPFRFDHRVGARRLIGIMIKCSLVLFFVSLLILSIVHFDELAMKYSGFIQNRDYGLNKEYNTRQQSIITTANIIIVVAGISLAYVFVMVVFIWLPVRLLRRNFRDKSGKFKKAIGISYLILSLPFVIFTYLPIATVLLWAFVCITAVIIYSSVRRASLLILNEASDPSKSPFSYFAATTNIVLLFFKTIYELLPTPLT